MKGNLALVTGVGRRKGIGPAICIELAKQGVDIFFTYWKQQDSEDYPETKEENPADLREELKALGVRAECIELDLSKPESATALFEAVTNSLGEPDILINNAAYDSIQPLSEVDAEVLDKHYAVNVRATTLLCREFVLQGKPGKIVNLTSGQSLDVMKNNLPYTITKAGVEMLTKQLAPELKERGISINAFDPGPTDTGWMTEDLKREIAKTRKVSTPEEAAQGIVTLLSEEQTGKVVHFGR